MTTINLADNEFHATRTESIRVEGGAYYLAMSESGGNTPSIELYLNVGAAKDVPFFGQTTSVPNGRVIVLPECTVSAQVFGLRGERISASLAYIGPVTVTQQASLVEAPFPQDIG